MRRLDAYAIPPIAPGNGSRYELVLVQDPHGGWLVLWPPVGWSAWVSTNGTEIKPHGNRLGKGEVNTILAIVGAFIDDLDGDEPPLTVIPGGAA